MSNSSVLASVLCDFFSQAWILQEKSVTEHWHLVFREVSVTGHGLVSTPCCLPFQKLFYLFLMSLSSQIQNICLTRSTPGLQRILNHVAVAVFAAFALFWSRIIVFAGISCFFLNAYRFSLVSPCSFSFDLLMKFFFRL